MNVSIENAGLLNLITIVLDLCNRCLESLHIHIFFYCTYIMIMHFCVCTIGQHAVPCVIMALCNFFSHDMPEALTAVYLQCVFFFLTWLSYLVTYLIFSVSVYTQSLMLVNIHCLVEMDVTIRYRHCRLAPLMVLLEQYNDWLTYPLK